MPQTRLAKCRILVVLLACLVGISFAAVDSARAQTPPKLKSGAVSPDYPEQAKDKMIVGDVVFRAKLAADGTVESVDVLQVPEKGLGFEESVQATVKNWTFEPATDGTNPIPYTYIGKVSFSLRPEEEKAIRETVQKAAEEWNKGNAGKVASHFDKDDGRIFGSEEIAKSSKKVQDWIKSQMSGDYKDSQIKVTVNSIVFFPDVDLAMITPFYSITGVNGQSQPLRGRLNLVLLKDKGDWNALSGQIVSRVGTDGFQVPKKLEGAEPNYPSAARQNRVQGTVVLRGVVDLDGTVGDVEVLRSIPELDKAAVDAVKAWKYEPATVAGSPTPMMTTMTVSFTLE
jgi:TonB family protein